MATCKTPIELINKVVTFMNDHPEVEVVLMKGSNLIEVKSTTEVVSCYGASCYESLSISDFKQATPTQQRMLLTGIPFGKRMQRALVWGL